MLLEFDQSIKLESDINYWYRDLTRLSLTNPWKSKTIYKVNIKNWTISLTGKTLTAQFLISTLFIAFDFHWLVKLWQVRSRYRGRFHFDSIQPNISQIWLVLPRLRFLAPNVSQGRDRQRNTFSWQENVSYFLPILDYCYYGTGLVREEPLDYVHAVAELSIRMII